MNDVNDVNDVLLSDVCKLLIENKSTFTDDESYYSVMLRLTEVCNTRFVNSKVKDVYDVEAMRSEVKYGRKV
jgi:hypothetical protein